MVTSRMTTSSVAIEPCCANRDVAALHFGHLVVAVAEGRAVLVLFVAREGAVGEAHVLLPERHIDGPGRAVALLPDDDLGLALLLGAQLLVVGGLAVHE